MKRDKSSDAPLPTMVPYVGRHMTTTWFLRNYECINERIWDPHYELSLFRLFDQSILINSPFHAPYIPEKTRKYIKSKRVLTIPHFGKGPFILHLSTNAQELGDIKEKMAALYSNQLEAKGSITDEFKQYCLRRLAIFLKGRTGIDMARLWTDMVNNKFEIENPKEVLVAVNCSEMTTPPALNTMTYSMTFSDFVGQRDLIMSKNYLRRINQEKSTLTVCNVENGDFKKFRIPYISKIAPIKTGGFVLVTSDNWISTLRGVNKFSNQLKLPESAQSLYTSKGLQPTFAILGSSGQIIHFGTLSPGKGISQSNEELIKNYDEYTIIDTHTQRKKRRHREKEKRRELKEQQRREKALKKLQEIRKQQRAQIQ